MWKLIQTTGVVNAVNCTIENSNAEGGATFYSFVVDGCFDGGDNTGWVFNGMRYTFTNVQENHTLDVYFRIRGGGNWV